MKPKKFQFATNSEHLADISPAKNYVPEWYRKAERYMGGAKNNSMTQGFDTRTLKHCVPFLDGLTFGYTVELWQDVEVVRQNDQIQLLTKTSPAVAYQRGASPAEALPVPWGHGPEHFVWQVPYTLKTPAGYSSFITHPFNRFDLPFTTLSAIVDTDAGMQPGNLPFFLKEGFEGLIPKGTPLFQILPFKRDNWESERVDELNKLGRINQALSNSVLEGYYKNNFWQKKNFN